MKQRLMKKLTSRNALSGSLGNLLEWYDFSLYGYFAAVIAKLFFPVEGKYTSLLMAFGVFAVGLFMRPIGGLILGHYGDKLGRKFALILSIVIITLPTFLMGVLPTYAQIGITATYILIFLRILQGLSVGGEFIGTTIFLVEHAPNTKRGIGGSFAYMGQTGGMLGSAFAITLTDLLTPEQLYSWGWRIPFLIGIVLGFFGLYMRKQVFETPPFCQLQKKHAVSRTPLKEVFQHHWKSVLTVFGLILFQAVSFYMILLYTVTWLNVELGLSKAITFPLNIIATIVFTALIPFFGKVSDKIGRKPLVMSACAAAFILTFPLFYLIALAPNTSSPFWFALLPLCIFSVILAAYHGPLAAILVEITPLKSRYSTLAVGYNFSAAIFGGTAPLVATYMVAKTNNIFAPCYYLMAASLITFLVVVFALKESYHRKID
ncbi:MAG: MFS transporter [Parachlamydiales bacterium]|nr:MFS transporter [Parachlamydiales bacterium]